jgi:hypothetical protein
MPQRETLAVTGYRDLMRGLQQADRESKREVRANLRKIGDVVRKDATSRFAPVSSHSAAGYRTRVRQKGIAVEQSIRKTTGRHPEYGGLQMRKALLPALMSNADDMNRQLEHALDVVCSRFNRGGHQWTG